MLRILCLSRAAAIRVLDGGFDVSAAADAQDPLVVDMDAMVVTQIVVDAAIALVRVLRVDILDLFGKPFILSPSAAEFAGRPLVVGAARNVQQFAFGLNRIARFLMTVSNGGVDVALPYL